MSTSTKISSVLLLSLLAVTTTANAHQGPKNHKHHKNVVVVKPKPPVRVAPKHHFYHFHAMPKHAVYVTIAGVMYAIVDDHYYRRAEQKYVYVKQPPVTVVEQISPSEKEQSTATGKLVNAIPASAVTVTINGATFYVDGHDWYAAIAGSNKYVTVEPQL